MENNVINIQLTEQEHMLMPTAANAEVTSAIMPN